VSLFLYYLSSCNDAPSLCDPLIDEAAQALEPSALIPLKYNPSRVVMVGDPCQLPATVFSATAKAAGYHQSFFEVRECVSSGVRECVYSTWDT
jgi:superfamily I DNA and/or RNA helicase